MSHFRFSSLPSELKESTMDMCPLSSNLQFLTVNRSIRRISLSRGPFNKRFIEYHLQFERPGGFFQEIPRIFAQNIKFSLKTVDFEGDPLESLLENEESLEKRMNAYRLLIKIIRYCPIISIRQPEWDQEKWMSVDRSRDERVDSWLNEFIPPIRHVRLLNISSSIGYFLGDSSLLLDGVMTIESTHLDIWPFLYRPGTSGVELRGLRKLMKNAVIRCDCKRLSINSRFICHTFFHIFHDHPIPSIRLHGESLAYWNWAVLDLVDCERRSGERLRVEEIDLRSLVNPPNWPFRDIHLEYEELLSPRILGDPERHDWREMVDEEWAEEIKQSLSLHQPVHGLRSHVWQPRFSWNHPIGQRRFYIFQAFRDEHQELWFNFRPLLA